MPITANTIVHFTNKKTYLKGILSDNFKVFFCAETISLTGESRTRFRVPIVSFCDIPLSQVKDHIDKYGKYGIGLTKEWAIRNKLNPVLYMSKGSYVSERFRLAYNHFTSMKDTISNLWTEEQQNLAEVMRYVKNYEGKLIRKGKVINENYRFADEREWRYTPSSTEFPKMMIAESAFTGDVYKEYVKKQSLILSKLRLKFEPNDIKYIIIKDDTEIDEFVEYLQRVKSKYQLGDMRKLITKFITVEKIKTDF